MYIDTGVATLTNYNQRNYALFTDLLKYVVNSADSTQITSNLTCPASEPVLKRKHGGRGRKMGTTGRGGLRSPVNGDLKFI